VGECKKMSVKRPDVVCLNCGKWYHPKFADRNKYCSRACAFEHKKAKPKIVIYPICLICGKQFNGRTNTKTCSLECWKKYRKRYDNDYDKNISIKNAIKCRECGVEFVAKYKDKHRIYCSDKCSIRHFRHIAKAKKRALVKSVFVKYISLKQLLIRDKYICQICKNKIDMRTKAPHPLSASRDHIVPLSLGGMEAPYNIQLAHFKCNSKKSNGFIDVGEQLRCL
jgi:hypothetical protein